MLTFVTVLSMGVEVGLVTGAALAISLHLWRNSQPRLVVEGHHDDAGKLRSTEHDGVDADATRPVLVLATR